MPQFPLPADTGQVITYQLAAVKPYGMRYKITPETTEKEVNARKCFQLPGSKEDVVKIQSVFPSPHGFKVREPEPGSDLLLRASSGSGWGCRAAGDAPLHPRGCRVLGQARTCPHSPGRREGHFPTRIRAGLPAPFPTPAAVLGHAAAHTNASVSERLGQVAARQLGSRRPQPPGKAGCSRRGAARERWGQQAVTKPDSEPDTGPQGKSLETRRKNPEPFGAGVQPGPPTMGVHTASCTMECPQGAAEPDKGVSVLCCTPNPCPTFHPMHGCVLMAM